MAGVLLIRSICINDAGVKGKMPMPAAVCRPRLHSEHPPHRHAAKAPTGAAGGALAGGRDGGEEGFDGEGGGRRWWKQAQR
jgi:hypothetical protein